MLSQTDAQLIVTERNPYTTAMCVRVESSAILSKKTLKKISDVPWVDRVHIENSSVIHVVVSSSLSDTERLKLFGSCNDDSRQADGIVKALNALL